MNLAVALLRGINVGGRAALKMVEVRAAFAAMGLAEVRTVLASGNVLFDAGGQAEKRLAKAIEEQLAAQFGWPIGVIVRPVAELEQLAARNPFGRIAESAETKLYVTFLGKPTGVDLKVPYRGKDNAFRIVKVGPREVCSVGSFAAASPFLEKTFGTEITTRNWNTVFKILAAAG
ncbi:MAG: DUF1697 domain-containing protein [Bauldia sp.]